LRRGLQGCQAPTSKEVVLHCVSDPSVTNCIFEEQPHKKTYMTSLLSQLRRNKADLLELALMGNPCLRRISTPFTREEILSEETRTLKLQMFATMMQEEGMGLAAPQVQINKRLVVIRYDSETEDIPNIPTTYLFNPVLTPRDDNGKTLNSPVSEKINFNPQRRTPGYAVPAYDGGLSFCSWYIIDSIAIDHFAHSSLRTCGTCMAISSCDLELFG